MQDEVIAQWQGSFYPAVVDEDYQVAVIAKGTPALREEPREETPSALDNC